MSEPLTPEAIDALLGEPSLIGRLATTAKAALERLAKVEQCGMCEGSGEIKTQTGFVTYAVTPCPHCPDCSPGATKGTGRLFPTWQDACRSLGDGAGREG
jgi:DnaJ-class molecular chaperone